MTGDEARIAAHEDAIQADPEYRAFMDQLTVDRQARQAQKRKRPTRRMWSRDRLPMSRAYMCGPKWRRAFDVKEIPIAELAPESAKYHRPGRKLLVFSLEADVRELVLERLRFDVYAMWSDPKERLGASASGPPSARAR